MKLAFNATYVLLSLVLTLFLNQSIAHNNPTFREDLIAVVEVVHIDGQLRSEPFDIEWEKKTVQLIWRTVADAADVSFSLFQSDQLVLENLLHDTPSKRVKGGGFSIADVRGTTDPFTIEIYAKVLDRSKKKGS